MFVHTSKAEVTNFSWPRSQVGMQPSPLMDATSLQGISRMAILVRPSLPIGHSTVGRVWIPDEQVSDTSTPNTLSHTILDFGSRF